MQAQRTHVLLWVCCLHNAAHSLHQSLQGVCVQGREKVTEGRRGRKGERDGGTERNRGEGREGEREQDGRSDRGRREGEGKKDFNSILQEA